jgi:hypothetical protein
MPEIAPRGCVRQAQACVEAMRPKRLDQLTVEIGGAFSRYTRERQLTDYAE